MKSPLENFAENPNIFLSWIDKYNPNNFDFDFEIFTDGAFMEFYSIKFKSNEFRSFDEMLSSMIIFSNYNFRFEPDIKYIRENYQEIIEDFFYNIQYKSDFISINKTREFYILMRNNDFLNLFKEIFNHMSKSVLYEYTKEDMLEIFMFNLEELEIYHIEENVEYPYNRYLGIGKNKMFLCRLN